MIRWGYPERITIWNQISSTTWQLSLATVSLSCFFCREYSDYQLLGRLMMMMMMMLLMMMMMMMMMMMRYNEIIYTIHDSWCVVHSTCKLPMIHLYDVGYYDDIDAASAFQTWTRISMKLFWVPWMKHQQLPSYYHIPIHLPHISKISGPKIPLILDNLWCTGKKPMVGISPHLNWSYHLHQSTSTIDSRIRKITPQIQWFTAPWSGWWLSPSEKWWSSSVGMMTFPTGWKNNPAMFQTTNQSLIFHYQRLNHH